MTVGILRLERYVATRSVGADALRGLREFTFTRTLVLNLGII